MNSCSEHRDAISAYADGETAPISRTQLAGHLERCEACRGYAGGLLEVERWVRATVAAPVPDLTADVLVAVDLPDAAGPARRHRQRRGLVALAGVVQLLLALPAVASLGTHVTRDLASFELALAGALLFVAWRPGAALGLLPMVGLVAAVGIVGAGIDATTGAATLAGELRHLLPVVTIAPLWRLSRGPATGPHGVGSVPA
jgi:predicted anti-sigma-YlaC factor YlaD